MPSQNVPGQNLVLQALPLTVLDRLKPRLAARSFAAGEVLFAADDTVSNLYFLQSGAVSLVSELAGGQMIESAMVGRDGVIGGGAALDDREAVHKAIVQVPGQGLSLDVDTARQVARDSETFRTAIIRHEQLVLAQAQQSAACNATHNLPERLARWLVRVRDATGSDSFVLTQEFIAEMLGVGRTSVSIVAHSLQQAGLVSYRRGHIKIEKVDALRDIACECYGTVKERYARALSLERAGNTLAR
jgi:CRP-like cAMP-binding protein